MQSLKEYISEVLMEYWGEVAGSVVRNQGTREAAKQSSILQSMNASSDVMMYDKEGVMVPEDVKEKLKKYFKKMKMTPVDIPGKTYK